MAQQNRFDYAREALFNAEHAAEHYDAQLTTFERVTLFVGALIQGEESQQKRFHSLMSTLKCNVQASEARIEALVQRELEMGETMEIRSDAEDLARTYGQHTAAKSGDTPQRQWRTPR